MPKSGQAPQKLVKDTILQECKAQITAQWFDDKLEIWGGFAGLSNATGFGSVFGHRANVQISGTVFGNYLPASYLIGISGHINPVGPVYKEFRCGAVVTAGKPLQPLYGEMWSRGDDKAKNVDFKDKGGGFDLSVNPYS